jgi:hypothetical protein
VGRMPKEHLPGTGNALACPVRGRMNASEMEAIRRMGNGIWGMEWETAGGRRLEKGKWREDITCEYIHNEGRSREGEIIGV